MLNIGRSLVALVKIGDLVTARPHIRWASLMSDYLATSTDISRTMYGTTIGVMRLTQRETAIVAEVNDEGEERRVKLIYKGSFWWGASEELSVVR